MTTVQPTLDGTIPEPDSGLSYTEWADQVRPAFVTAARTGRLFTTYEVTHDNNLPEPPNSKSDWGNFTQGLVRDRLIEHVTFDRSSRPTAERSAVHVWRGTRAAQAGRVA
jgi:hypothetical protein